MNQAQDLRVIELLESIDNAIRMLVIAFSTTLTEPQAIATIQALKKAELL